jgi:3-dehydroquinate synthase
MSDYKIDSSRGSYFVQIKNGLLTRIGEEVKRVYKGEKIILITDNNLDRFYGQQLIANLKNHNYKIDKIVLEPGEGSKSFDTLQRIYSDLLDVGATRADLIITFGGGVVGDIGGFAAATFLRGVPYVQIPTSLLAQVDSSIGGKVAVNLSRGKNMVGSFYPPRLVVIDPELLQTLEQRFFNDGMGEVIKYGAIKDANLFYRLLAYETEKDLQLELENIVYICCGIKKLLVEKDELDSGERMILNFGHTVGHALEKYYNYERYTHGEAIGIGMYTITKNSEQLGLTKKGTAELLQKVLTKYGLPYAPADIDKWKLLDIIARDKKRAGDCINLVVLKRIGEGFIKKVKLEEMEMYI